MQKTYVLLSNQDDTDIDFHGPFAEPEKSAVELLRERRPFSTSVYFLVVDFDNHDVKLVLGSAALDEILESSVTP